MATVETLARDMGQLMQRLVLTEQQSGQLAENLEKLRQESDRAITAANVRIGELYNQRNEREERVDLIDIRSMDPGVFTGSEKESWRQSAKRIKAYCNVRTPGFRAALDFAEAETVP